MKGLSGARDPMCRLGTYEFAEGVYTGEVVLGSRKFHGEMGCKPWRNAGACAGSRQNLIGDLNFTCHSDSNLIIGEQSWGYIL
jgi:hypothetical protein